MTNHVTYGCQVREEFQKQMGVAASEQRVEAYMKKNTIGGKTMLDPTGILMHRAFALLDTIKWHEGR